MTHRALKSIIVIATGLTALGIAAAPAVTAPAVAQVTVVTADAPAPNGAEWG